MKQDFQEIEVCSVATTSIMELSTMFAAIMDFKMLLEPTTKSNAPVVPESVPIDNRNNCDD